MLPSRQSPEDILSGSVLDSTDSAAGTADVNIAPISVVRHLNNLIIGPSVDDDSNQSLNVLSEIGLESGGFADILFEKY